MTWVTPSMCSPREATSVATRMGSSPSLKSFRIFSRFFWSTSPVRARACQPLRPEPVLEAPRLLARVGEDQDAAAPLALEQAEEQVELLLAPDVVEHLLDLLDRLLVRA